MTPHLVKWQEKYGDQGFQVLEVDDGMQDPLNAVKRHADELILPYPILHDASGSTCTTYGVQAFPSAYLIGRDGKVVWEGNPIGDGSEEAQVVDALKAS